jgi:hypothetical protein
MRSTLLSISILASLVLLTSCQRGSRDVYEGEDGELVIGQAEVSETTARGVNPGNRTLVIAGFNGVVELSGTDDATAQLEFTTRARGRNDSAARETLAGISIDESGAEDAYRFDLTSQHRDRSSVDVRGTVPVNTPLRIEMAHGVISVSGADGPVEIAVSNGTVRVGGTSRDVSVEVSNGDIEVGTRMIQPDGSIRLETANGDVTLRMPASSSVRVDARTSVGTVHVAGLDFASRRLQREVAGASFSGQLGGGNARVDVRVQNGVIRLLEGQTLSLEGLQLPQGPFDAFDADTLDVDVAPDTTGMDRSDVDTTEADTTSIVSP